MEKLEHDLYIEGVSQHVQWELILTLDMSDYAMCKDLGLAHPKN